MEETLSGSSKKKRKLDISKSTLLPQNECLFCEKEYIYVKRRKELKLSKCLTVEDKTAIYEAAKRKKDTRILGICEAYCRIAKEAIYHATCRRDYTLEKLRIKRMIQMMTKKILSQPTKMLQNG